MTTWQKSSYSSDSANCVEVRHSNGRIEVRDSKLGDASPVLTYSPDQWRRLLEQVKAKDEIETWYVTGPGHRMSWCWGQHGSDVVLKFTIGEILAFTRGVKAGEFDGPPPCESLGDGELAAMVASPPN
jgi:hypothetical protein